MADETYIYAGAEAHGLYRKKASDTHWEQLTNGYAPMPQARPIVIHPHHPEVLFVGTQRGVYRSQDRGDHWQRMHLPEGRTVWSPVPSTRPAGHVSRHGRERSLYQQ